MPLEPINYRVPAKKKSALAPELKWLLILLIVLIGAFFLAFVGVVFWSIIFGYNG
jgi:flagellar basal body-associated protein FliL